MSVIRFVCLFVCLFACLLVQGAVGVDLKAPWFVEQVCLLIPRRLRSFTSIYTDLPFALLGCTQVKLCTTSCIILFSCSAFDTNISCMLVDRFFVSLFPVHYLERGQPGSRSRSRVQIWLPLFINESSSLRAKRKF